MKPTGTVCQWSSCWSAVIPDHGARWIQYLLHFSYTEHWRLPGTTNYLSKNIWREGDPDKVDTLFPTRAGGDVQPGSNAWAVSGEWTESGKPLLANDPHLPFSIPSLWHQIHLKGGELNVSGVTLPGLPGVLIGHNQSIAWGITNLRFDSQDLYIENFDPRTGTL